VAQGDALKQFAGTVRAYRTRAGLSQEELAGATGLHRTEISLLERGLREPRLMTVVRLGRAFGCPPSELLEDIS
jgi:transcriptional regulator with XRE-family HTH domain